MLLVYFLIVDEKSQKIDKILEFVALALALSVHVLFDCYSIIYD